ncbi:MAG: sulfurtransferase, partial [Betaproteobacteria bacterium]|nr:sulfurtransferase [Betaproteobacteria bacterium]
MNSFTTLVCAETLARHLGDAGWIVVDCRHDLFDTEAGRRAYARSHVPGACFLHLDEDLSGEKNRRNGRHPLPAPEVFCARLGSLGVDGTRQVVAYDASGGVYAARLWWMLRWVGHAGVAVLDGGWDAWVKSGQPVTAEQPRASPVHFECRVQPLAVDAAHVVCHLEEPGLCLIDARSPDRFRGENETLDPVGGHI